MTASPDSLAARLLLVAQAIKPLKGLEGMDATLHEAIAALEAGAGGVVVPREPTEDMQIAFCEAWFSKRRAIDDPEMQDAYAAMIAAAPKASEAVGGTTADDLRLYGTAYEIDGVRIDPRRILIHTPQADPAPPVAGEVVEEVIAGLEAIERARMSRKDYAICDAVNLLRDHARMVAALQAEIQELRK